MTTKLAVTSVKVLDQDEALDFYVNKLGLEKGADIKQGPFRWLTVRFPGGAGPAGPRRSHRCAAPRADHQGRDGLPRPSHGRRPGPL